MASRGVVLTLDPTPETAQLRRRTQFRDGEEVAAYLERHPWMAPILLDALDRIPQFFGEDAPMALEVFWDPEDAEHKQL